MSLLPNKIRFIFDTLNNKGFECYAVGGCVRDSIMGNEPSDWDFTTNAEPHEIIECFSEYKIVDTGKEYGTIAVVNDGECYEITTFRIDGEYSDSRHPDKVYFSHSIKDDLSRRDFTMNSVAYSDTDGYIDPYGGITDIENRIIRTTGTPDKRFKEDALRILRVVRFFAKLGFTVSSDTEKNMFLHKDLLDNVHPQRIKKEFEGLLLADNVAEAIDKYREIIFQIIPELEPMQDTSQNNPHHSYDVWTHTLRALDNTPNDLIIRLAVLFHDSGKPSVKTTDKNGIDHFKTHQIKSAEIAKNVLCRFGFSSSVINDTCLLIRYHDERFLKRTEDIKRTLSVIEEELFDKLVLVINADISAQSEYKRGMKLQNLNYVVDEKKRIIEENECYKISQLSINGNDLVSAGLRGKEIGVVLDMLLDAVIKGKCENTRGNLLNHIKS